MLRIADMPRGQQYTLSQDGVFLFIHMERDFARDVAVEVTKIAYNSRSRLTNPVDVQMLGDFTPYRDGRPWGYGHCVLIEPDGDQESWKVAMPPWKDNAQAFEAIQAQSQAFLTLEAIFAGINVPNERYELRERKQRIEVDLHYDAASGLFGLKAEIGKQAVNCVSRLTKDEFKYIRETMALAAENLLPIGDNPYRNRMLCAYSLEKPLWFSMGDTDFAASGLSLGGGCHLSTEEELTVYQALTFVAGLAALDEVLEDFVSPIH